ncbi:hypothetical protein ABFG93_03230 [Pseudalkalibacillus hwajinpoensis]|uniref:hypothetical protein n=1 Tax=Guptibacillus hwajinpoensis TaxID=208199 RepID=UPI00325BC999
MVLVWIALFAMFLMLGLFMLVIWSGIKTDSMKSDCEDLWANYEEVMDKEKIF